MKNFEIKLKLSGLLKSQNTTKYFSIILQSILHKTVEAANYFGHYLSLDKSLNIAYF